MDMNCVVLKKKYISMLIYNTDNGEKLLDQKNVLADHSTIVEATYLAHPLLNTVILFCFLVGQVGVRVHSL